MCFPFVDEDTKTTLQSLMDEAENITDFTERLCDKVCSEPSSPLLEYFAFYFPYHIDYYALIDRLESAGKMSDLAEPLLLITKVRQGLRISWDEMKSSLMKALNVAPNDWIATHLYLTWRLAAEYYFPESDVDVRPIEAITSSVNENKDLKFFKAFLLLIEARAFLREYKRKDAMILLRQALTIARKFDDQIMVANLLHLLANLIKHSDVKQAIDLLISSRELSEQLGYRNGIGQVQNELGFIMGLRGELDASIEHQFEYCAIRESLGLSTFWINNVIAFHYNQAGNGEKALELAKTALALDDSGSRWLALTRAQMAWALIILGRFDEAKAEIVVCHELASKSGDSQPMAWYNMVEGILDKAESNFENAVTNFKEVLKFYDEDPVPLFQNICLLNLTEIEIEMLTEKSLDEKSESSGPWMKKLEEHVKTNDLPGVAAQSMIIKAKLRHRQGQYDEVRKILKEVAKIAQARFPYVDEETKSVLQSIMDEAEDFGDFTKRLCDRVCSESSSPMLEYFAFFFPFHIHDHNLINRLEAAGKLHDIAKPLFLISMAQHGEPISWEEIKHSVTQALAATPNDWITSHLYLQWRYHADLIFPECDIDIKPIEAVTRSVTENKELEFFKLYLLRIQAQNLLREQNLKEMIELLNKAIILARKHDEQFVLARLLHELANKVKHTNVKRAIDILLTARELSEQLGYLYNIGLVQSELGHIMGVRGEFNAAIEHNLEYARILKSLACPGPATYAVIASYLNQSGNGEKALELARTSIDLLSSSPRIASYAHTQMAYAWINLEKYDEAKAELAIAQNLVTKSGDSRLLVWCRLVEGILDKVEGRFDSAIQCFTEVTKYLEEDPTPLWQNICLLNLTDIEIAKLTKDSLDKVTTHSGPWMRKLEEHTQKNDLPGIAAQSLLLKAKLCHRQGHFDEIRKILKEVQKIAKSPSMKYLNDLAISMFPDIIVS
jgi:tetratricopeptide (TPR) repeat protein